MNIKFTFSPPKTIQCQAFDDFIFECSFSGSPIDNKSNDKIDSKIMWTINVDVSAGKNIK